MMYKHCSMWNGHLDQTNSVQHCIKIKPVANPGRRQTYYAGPAARETVQENVGAILQQGVIEAAQTDWSYPVVLVPKTDEFWICIDYRQFNGNRSATPILSRGWTIA